MPDTTGLPKMKLPLRLVPVNARPFEPPQHYDIHDAEDYYCGSLDTSRLDPHEIVRRCNAFEGVVGALKELRNCMNGLHQFTGSELEAIERAEDILAAAEEGRE